MCVVYVFAGGVCACVKRFWCTATLHVIQCKICHHFHQIYSSASWLISGRLSCTLLLTVGWEWIEFLSNGDLMFSGMCRLSSCQCMTLTLVIWTSKWLGNPLKQCCGEANQKHEAIVGFCFVPEDCAINSLCMHLSLCETAYHHMYQYKFESCQGAFQVLH